MITTVRKLLLLGLLVFVSACLPTSEEMSDLEFEARHNSRYPASFNRAASVAGFQSTVYPLLRSKTCFDCHSEAGDELKFLSDDVNAAYVTMVETGRKVNLLSPATSRIYLRVLNDRHNCFATDCETAAALILAEISEWASLAGAGGVVGISTDDLLFSDQETVSAQVEFGTVMLQAEQSDFLETMIGRFEIDLDGKASDSKYALTRPPSINPTTTAVRTASFNKGNNCEVVDAADLLNSTTGPYAISEQATHINTGQVTPNPSLIIKDGHRPFSIGMRALLIRPDKRMEYAKRLTGWSAGTASGSSDFLQLADVYLADGNFDVEDNVELSSNQRFTGVIKISTATLPLNANEYNLQLQGDELDFLGFKILPNFTKRDDVFEVGGNYKQTPTAQIPDLSGGTLNLQSLFAPPQIQLTTKQILDNIEIGNFSETAATDYRRNVLFKVIWENLTQAAVSGDSYDNIIGMNLAQFRTLYGALELQVEACPIVNGAAVCGPDTQDIEITPGSTTGGEPLTYANSLDILKINGAGNAFIAGDETELIAGTAFRRLDLYAHIYEPGNARSPGDNWTNTFYSFNGTSFSETSNINFPINNTNSNINLLALYTAGSNQLSPNDNLENFQNSLHPVLTSAVCASCHNSADNQRVPHSDGVSIVSFNALMGDNLINFNTPLNSFRKTFEPGAAFMVHNCNGTNDNDNAALCPSIQTAFVNAINTWGAANVASAANSNAQQYTIMTEAQRTPGQLEYSFLVTETGYYNVWTKVKSGNGLATDISVRIMDGTSPLTTFRGINSLISSPNSCVGYTLGDNDDWTWYTPGRGNELPNLNSLGEIKLDSNGDPRTISDNRRYWMLEAGKDYKLQVFERNVNTKVDLVAIDRVRDHADALDFQPDLLARDENNISDYKRKRLSYDISSKVGLPAGSAFFKVEIKEALGGQNYIFRNPRFYSPNANLRVSNIKVFINGATSYSDSAWTRINVSTGDDKILTYAPLVTLVENGSASDTFHFNFDILQQTTDVLTEVDPRGAAPIIIDGRRCKEIDLFMNTVKPILRNARLVRKTDDGLQEYLDDFPGIRRNDVNNPEFYQCMTCHDDTHPYFKMTTFDYPEILCSQALSRVDFENYPDSLLVRGIDGSGIHPKLYFMEQLQYAADLRSVVQYDPNNGTRILDGQIRNNVDGDDGDFFSKWFPGGYFSTYSQADLGLSSTWNNNNTAAKEKARAHLGEIRRITYEAIPALSNEVYYEPFVHDQLVGEIRTEADNLATGVFNQNSRSRYNTYIPTDASGLGNRSLDIKVEKSGNNIVTDENGKVFLEGYRDEAQMVEQFEQIKSDYRQIILNWIAAEDAARQP
jgi:hypothetical protein